MGAMGAICPLDTAPTAPAPLTGHVDDQDQIRSQTAAVHVPSTTYPTFLSCLKQFSTYFPISSTAELLKALQSGVLLQAPLLDSW